MAIKQTIIPVPCIGLEVIQVALREQGIRYACIDKLKLAGVLIDGKTIMFKTPKGFEFADAYQHKYNLERNEQDIIGYFSGRNQELTIMDSHKRKASAVFVVVEKDE